MRYAGQCWSVTATSASCDCLAVGVWFSYVFMTDADLSDQARPVRLSAYARDLRPRPLVYVDVYLDDILGLLQLPGRSPTEFIRTILHTIDRVFCPLSADDSPHRTETWRSSSAMRPAARRS